MILSEYLKENQLILSSKGISAMGRAFKEVYPHTEMWISHDDDGNYFVSKFIEMDLPDKDCLKILELTARYAGLWAFA